MAERQMPPVRVTVGINTAGRGHSEVSNVHFAFSFSISQIIQLRNINSVKNLIVFHYEPPA